MVVLAKVSPLAGEVEGDVVGEHRQAGGPFLGLGPGEVVLVHRPVLPAPVRSVPCSPPACAPRRPPVALRLVRIALVCPYSLTVPGGVQGQVLGLARALRAPGHDVRVLGPCDGPPPEVGVIPLGNSIPTAANGSMAPHRPRPLVRPAHHRRPARRALRRPPPPRAARPRARRVTCVVLRQRADGGHVPRRRGERRLPGAAPPHPLAGPPPQRPLRGVRGRQGAWPCGHLGGEYLVLHNGIEVERFAKATPVAHRRARRSCSCPATSPARASTCCSTAWPTCPPTPGCGWPATGPRPAGCRPRTAGDHRVEWLGRIGDERAGAAPAGGRRAVRPVAAGRVVRDGAAGGHGRPDAGRGQRHPRLPQRGRRGGGQAALLVPPGDAAPWPPPSPGSWTSRPTAGRPGGGGGGPGRRVLHGPPGRALRRRSTGRRSRPPRARRPARSPRRAV